MQLTSSSKQLVQPLVRAIQTSASTAANAVTVAKTSSGGLFGFGGGARIDTPLDTPLAGVQSPLRSSTTTPAKFESSQLADGVKVASITSVSPVSTIALVLSGGSSVETSDTAGASKVIEALAFKATKDRTTFRITRELEKIGATSYAKASRDSITFAIDTLKTNTPEATEILLDSVLNAKLLYHEFRDNAEIAHETINKALSSPAAVLEEVVHRVAFDGPLGQPLLVDPKAISHEALRAYYASLLKPSSILLAGVGADHAELKELAGPLFGAAGLKAAGAVPAASKYVGGSANVIADTPLTHVALAFEAKGGVSDTKSEALAAVTKALLCEARSAVPYAVQASALKGFAYSYKDSGIVGVSASSAPAQASALVDSVYKKIGSLASGVTEAQISVAKQVAIGNYKAAQASSSTALPLIASKLLATGKFDSAEFASVVSSITAAQATAYIKELTKSAPTVVTYGSLSSLPRYDSLAKRLA